MVVKHLQTDPEEMIVKAVPANRWQAFAWHIGISAVLFILLSWVIYFLWYPGFLFQHDGGLDGVKLIAGVDFLIGPFLTLCVYKLGKKGLRLDLIIIGILQIACLSYGMWTVWQTRPVAVVYVMGQFRTVSYEVFVDYEVNPGQVPILKSTWPVWVAVDLPRSEIPEFHSYKDRFLFQNGHTFQSERYVPFSTYWPVMQTEASSRERLLEKHEDLNEKINTFGADTLFFNLGTGNGAGYLGMTPEGEVVDVIFTMTRKSAYAYYLEKLKNFFMQPGDL
jgi:hypothetical protein